MNINQLKTKIVVLKTLDTILILSVIIAGLYTYFYSENKEAMFIACLVGLYLVNTIGNYISNKVALMQMTIDMLERDKKREEQRTLMRTRHTTIR